MHSANIKCYENINLSWARNASKSHSESLASEASLGGALFSFAESWKQNRRCSTYSIQHTDLSFLSVFSSVFCCDLSCSAKNKASYEYFFNKKSLFRKFKPFFEDQHQYFEVKYVWIRNLNLCIPKQKTRICMVLLQCQLHAENWFGLVVRGSLIWDGKVVYLLIAINIFAFSGCPAWTCRILLCGFRMAKFTICISAAASHKKSTIVPRSIHFTLIFNYLSRRTPR